MSKIYNKKIFVIVDNIDSDPTKIYFCELCVNTKITQNLSTKPISKVSIKLVKVHIDF